MTRHSRDCESFNICHNKSRCLASSFQGNSFSHGGSDVFQAGGLTGVIWGRSSNHGWVDIKISPAKKVDIQIRVWLFNMSIQKYFSIFSYILSSTTLFDWRICERVLRGQRRLNMLLPHMHRSPELFQNFSEGAVCETAIVALDSYQNSSCQPPCILSEKRPSEPMWEYSRTISRKVTASEWVCGWLQKVKTRVSTEE